MIEEMKENLPRDAFSYGTYCARLKINRCNFLLLKLPHLSVIGVEECEDKYHLITKEARQTITQQGCISGSISTIQRGNLG